MKYRLQSMYNHIVGRAASVLSPYYGYIQFKTVFFQLLSDQYNEKDIFQLLSDQYNEKDIFEFSAILFNSDNFLDCL